VLTNTFSALGRAEHSRTFEGIQGLPNLHQVILVEVDRICLLLGLRASGTRPTERTGNLLGEVRWQLRLQVCTLEDLCILSLKLVRIKLIGCVDIRLRRRDEFRVQRQTIFFVPQIQATTYVRVCVVLVLLENPTKWLVEKRFEGLVKTSFQ
jgi:hypothetical protein